MKTNNPDGWKEPVVRGLWQYETLFGAPRFMVWVQASLLPLVFFGEIRLWVYSAGVLQMISVAATRWDPEWPRMLCDLFEIPSELDP